jgi:hypothetical protein
MNNIEQNKTSSNDAIGQSIVQLIKKLDSYPGILDDLQQEKIIKLARVLDSYPDISNQINDVLIEKTEDNPERFRQLRDVNNYLQILDSKLQQDPIIEKKLAHDYHQIILKVNKAVQFAAEIHSIPPWQSLLEAIDKNILLADSNYQSKKTAPPNLENYKFPIPLTVQGFAQMHGEAFIKDSGLEGHTQKKMLQYLLSHLLNSTTSLSATGKKVAKSLETSLDIFNRFPIYQIENTEELFTIKDSFCSFIQLNLKELQKEESFLLPTGWISYNGGHAMYMEMIKQENGQFTVRLFNSGAGIENHPSIFIHETFKSYPCLELRDIDASKLTNKDFLTALLEIKVCSKDQDKILTNYSKKDLYDILWPYLGGTDTAKVGEIEKFIIPQHSGTCTWSSLMAILHFYLSKNEFCRIQHDIHLISLCDFFNQQKSNLARNEELRMLLQKSAEQFCRELLNNYQKKEITLEELITGKEAMQVILTSLHQAKQQAEYEAANSRVFDSKGIENIPIKIGSMSPIPVKPLHSQKNSLPPNTLEFPYDNFSWMNNSKSIDFEMENFRLRCEQNLKNLNSQIILQENFNNFFIHLPSVSTGEDFWKTLPNDKILKCMHEITLISELMFRNYTSIDPSQWSKVEAHLLKGLATVHRLGCLSPELSSLLAKKSSLPFKNSLRDMIGTENDGRPMWDANVYGTKSRADLKLVFDYLNEFGSDSSSSKPNLFIINHQEKNFLIRFEQYQGFFERGLSEKIAEISYIKKLLAEKEIQEKLFIKYPESKELPYYQQFGYALTDVEGEILPQSFCDLKKMAVLSKAISLKLHPSEVQKNNKINLPITIDQNSGLVQIKTREKQTDTLASFGDIKNPSLNFLIQKSREKRKNNAFRETNEDGALSEADIYRFTNTTSILGKFSGEIKEISFTLADFKDLLCLMTGADYDGNDTHLEMQVSKTISYFSSHLSKLKDPDYQAFIRLLLFEACYLESFLHCAPSFAATLSTFISHGYETFLERGDVFTASFFIELGRHLETVVKEVGIQKQNIAFPDPHQAIEKLLKINSCTADEKIILYKHFVASYATHPKKDLEADDVKDILSAIAYIKANPACALRNSSHLDQEVSQVLVRYRKDIIKHMQTDAEAQKILQAVVKRLDIQQDFAKIWDVTSQFPLCTSTDGVFSFDLFNGCFYHREKQLSVLPKIITDSELFKNIFPRTDYRVSRIDDVYEFKDDEDRLTTCIQSNKKTIIQKELEKDVIYQYIPEENLPNEITKEQQTLLGSLSLLHGKTYWKNYDSDSEQKILVLNKERKIEYQLSLTKAPASETIEPSKDVINIFFYHDTEGDIEEAVREKVILIEPGGGGSKQFLIEEDQATPSKAEKREKHISSLMLSPSSELTPWLRQAKEIICYYQEQSESIQITSIEKVMPDGSRLKLADIYPEKTAFDFIKSFAGGQDVLFWKNDKGVPELLEIPKLNLQFKWVKNGMGWEAHCLQMPGFQISANQKLKGLPTFQSALVMENSKGDRKVLIPRLKIKTEKKGALTTTFNLQRSEKDEVEPHLPFDMDAKKGIHSSHREQQLFLAYLYLGKKEYGHFQEILTKSYSKAIPYTKQEQELLEWMLELHKDNKDADPKASAIYLMVLAQLLKIPNYQIPDDSALSKSLCHDYNTYSTLFDHTTTFKLTREEELSIIPKLMSLAQRHDVGFKFMQIASMRLAILKSESLQDYATVMFPSLDHEEEDIDYSLNQNDFENILTKIENADTAEKTNILITRPGKTLVQHLLLFYKMAKERHPSLTLILAFAARDEHVNKSALSLLKTVWKDPASFPDDKTFKTILDTNDRRLFREKFLITSTHLFTPSSSVPQKERTDLIRIEAKAPEQPALPKLQSSAIKLSAPKETIKILTNTQMKSCFKKVGKIGIELSEQEIKELKSSIDLTKEKGIAKIKSQALQDDIEHFCSTPLKEQSFLLANKCTALKTILLVQQAESQKRGLAICNLC